MVTKASIKLIGLSLLAVYSMNVAPAIADDNKSVCIRSLDIDNTEFPDDNTMLFHMRGGKIWMNKLTSTCVGLKMETHGYVFEATNPGTEEMCSNLQTIRLRDTGETCFLGDFTPIDKATARAMMQKR